jgi:hypothetical protein
MTFIERLSRYLFEKNRLPILFALWIVPFLIAFSLLAPRFLSLREMEFKLDAAALRGRSALEKRAQKEQFLRRYSDFTPYFIDQTLEPLSFMQTELKHLRSLQSHPACPDRKSIERRIAFLEGMDNRLLFAEEAVRTSKRLKETDERLMHPIEINSDDLEHLLCLIEGIPIGPFTPNPQSPQLIIRDIQLDRKNENVYQLELSLLKREFIRAHEKKN